MFDTLADKALVRRLLAGDEAAFKTFFDTYFDRLFRFCLRRLGGDREATRDVTQQTLIRAVERIGSWRGEAQLYTWLCTLCRHEVVDYLRRESRHDGNVELFEDTPQVRSALESLDVHDSGDPVAQAAREQRIGRLQVALDQLPPRYGDALEWKYVYGYTTAEIAKRFGVGGEAAQSLLARARRAFHDIWLDVEDADTPSATIRGNSTS
jgi:RNA polymerase sigma-70 factor (ECF subfamily)